MAEESTFLTPAAHRKLSEELDYLESEGRMAIEARIAEARSHGDLRENADYDTAKNDQGLMEARIRKLRHLLDTAEVREVADTGRVEVGSVVIVADDDGDRLTYLVATPENKVTGLKVISPDSPLGRVLLGAAPGDRVSYQAPAGEFAVTVESVRPFED